MSRSKLRPTRNSLIVERIVLCPGSNGVQRYLEDFVTASDQHAIPYRAWLAEDPAANLLISHGMSEHAGRYESFADYLTAHNINAWAIEHRGHGAHCRQEDRGHYADHDGWQKVVSDLNLVKRRIISESPDLPHVLLGHSMGSYVALAAVMAEADGCDGLLLTGSGLNSRILLGAGIAIAWLEKLRLGDRGKSKLMSTMTFQTFNRRFKPNRTAYDWLSRDTAEVDKYVADPLCGFSCTNQFWLDLLRGQFALSRLKNICAIPHQLPIRLISGGEDPVGRLGAGVRQLQHVLKAGGVKVVDVDLVAGARHEVFGDLGKDDTCASTVQWIQRIVLHNLNKIG